MGSLHRSCSPLHSLCCKPISRDVWTKSNDKLILNTYLTENSNFWFAKPRSCHCFTQAEALRPQCWHPCHFLTFTFYTHKHCHSWEHLSHWERTASDLRQTMKNTTFHKSNTWVFYIQVLDFVSYSPKLNPKLENTDQCLLDCKILFTFYFFRQHGFIILLL